VHYKTKELIMYFRRQQREHAPSHIQRAAVERVKIFKFLGVQITDNLKWYIHTDAVLKMVQQCHSTSGGSATQTTACSLRYHLEGGDSTDAS
jgi:hypothetical protein